MNFIVDLLERVGSTFIVAYVGAVTVLPGGIWSAHNWQIAATAALGSTVKGLVASRVGDKGTAALLPAVGGAAGGAAGAAVGGAAGAAVGETVGGIGEAAKDVATGITGLLGKILGRKP
jgi:hypothetical protein